MKNRLIILMSCLGFTSQSWTIETPIESTPVYAWVRHDPTSLHPDLVAFILTNGTKYSLDKSTRFVNFLMQHFDRTTEGRSIEALINADPNLKTHWRDMQLNSDQFNPEEKSESCFEDESSFDYLFGGKSI